MNFDRKGLEEYGFQGFVTVRQLRKDDCRKVPGAPGDRGVYVVMFQGTRCPGFLDMSLGGHFRGDPSVSKEELKKNWVKGAQALNIGQAGGWIEKRQKFSDQTLHDRVRALVCFAHGDDSARHWGGRYLWQVRGCHGFLVAWKKSSEGADPRKEEESLIRQFRLVYGVRPFANLTD
jgi:hypothetical protein